MAGPYPGRPDETAAAESLRELTLSRVTQFIDLTFPKGEGTNDLEPYEHLLDQLPNESLPGYSRLSIVDEDIPSAEFMNEILNEINSSLSRDEVVYVHCWGGVGRTGTEVACHHIASGMSADEALKTIRGKRTSLLRGHRLSPETYAQEEFVRAWE